jgi:signal transduction histidine kinase
VAVALVAVMQIATGYHLLLADIAVLIMVYSVSAYGSRWAGRAALAGAIAGSVVVALALTGLSQGEILADTGVHDFLVLSLMASALIVAAWALGLMRSARKETISALKARTAALEDRAKQLELERDQQRIIATQAERARIAREMHDIVSHSLSIMIVQADGGRYIAASNPDAAGEALATISNTGRQALKEMRRLLGVLRSDTSSGGFPTGAISGSESTETGLVLTPLPGSVQGSGAEANLNTPGETGLFPPGLDELFAQSRAAGMPLKVSTSGVPKTLQPSEALTLQRVCQEALTNVRKHAGSASKANVQLVWHGAEVELVVSDDGKGSHIGQISDPGYGLIGLKERAALVGGTIFAGPKPNGGWETRFTMPV